MTFAVGVARSRATCAVAHLLLRSAGKTAPHLRRGALVASSSRGPRTPLSVEQRDRAERRDDLGPLSQPVAPLLTLDEKRPNADHMGSCAVEQAQRRSHLATRGDHVVDEHHSLSLHGRQPTTIQQQRLLTVTGDRGQGFAERITQMHLA